MKPSALQRPTRAPARRLAILATLGALALTGCAAVGPDYRAPQPDIPAKWTATTDNRTLDPAVLAEWWRAFHDPLLNELVTEALAANLDLATAQAQLRESRARRALAGAQLGPSVDVSASGAHNRSSAESGSGKSGELYSAGFDASWEVDVFGGLRRAVEAAEADLDASAESLRDTQVSLVAEVARNYVELRTAQRRLAIAESTLASRSETFDLVRWRYQAGLVTELDVAQAHTDLESTRAGLPPLRTAVSEARNRLAVLLNRAPGELQAKLSTTAAVPLTDRAAAAGIPADTLRQRPDVRAAERRLAAQTARLGEAEAARYPSFNLTGSLGLEALSVSALGNSGAHTYSLLAAIGAPIFDAGRIRANIEIQDALLEQARLDYQGAVLTALEDVENALVALANIDERRTRLSQATDSARITLQLAEHRYASGLTDFLTVLDSQRTLLDLEDQLANSAGELAGAQIQLYKAMGGGWSPGDEPQVSRNDS